MKIKPKQKTAIWNEEKQINACGITEKVVILQRSVE